MMNLRRKPAVSACTALLLTGCMLLLSAHAEAVSAVLYGRVMLCLRTLVPSLYGCTMLGALLCMSGAAQALGHSLRFAADRLHLSHGAFGIFLVSQLAGYPVGSMLLRQASERGDLTEQDAARLSCVCFGGGPAFLIGLAGGQLLGSNACGLCIMLCGMCANLIMAAVMRPQREPARESGGSGCRLDAGMLTDAAAAAVRSMTMICAAVLLFGVIGCTAELCGILRLLTALGGVCGIAPHTVRAAVSAFADVTQLADLAACGLPDPVLIPLTAGLLSFGGCCVLIQCRAVGVRSLRLRTLFLSRISAALLTAFLVRLCLPLLPLSLPECAAEAFAHQTAVSESGSVLPALLIFLTGFPFLLKKD